ncbi:MAG: hypothetical protein ACHP65_08775 [Legionellales bacterium]
METNEEMFIRCVRQSMLLLKENGAAHIGVPEEGFTLSEKRKIELALHDCKIEWGTPAIITKRKIGNQ